MNISNDIISFLFSFRKITLPGLGTILINRYSSKRNPVKNKLEGPGFYCDFQYDKYDEGLVNTFVEFISNKYNLDKHKAESKFNKYSLELLNDIANFGNATIQNLGKFSRKNDKLEFNFSDIFNEIIKNSYPEQSLVAVKRNVIKGNENIKDNNSYKSHSKKKNNNSNNNLIFPLIILTIASIVLICFLNCLFNIFNKFDTNSGIKAATEDTISSNNTNKLSSDTSEEFPLDTIENNSTAQSNDSLNSNINNNAEKNSNTDIITSNNAENNSTDSTTNIKTDTIKKISLDELIKMSPELRKSYEKSCIIITGSFIKKYYANRMIKRLSKYGYSPYSEKFGKFHRTGVIFDCNKKPLNEFLRELKRNIEPESWVLKWN